MGEMQRLSPVFAYYEDGALDFRGCVYRYPGRAGQAVRKLKYQRATSLADSMAQILAQSVLEEGAEFDIAVPVPIHWFRLAWRGFNQADLLASKLPNRRLCLRRVRATRPQAGLTTEERLYNLEGAFEVIVPVAGKKILLIDDVVTSGKTANECAKALKAAGAIEVGVLAFCGESIPGFTDVQRYTGE